MRVLLIEQAFRRFSYRGWGIRYYTDTQGTASPTCNVCVCHSQEEQEKQALHG